MNILTKIIFELSSNTHLISSAAICMHIKGLTIRNVQLEEIVDAFLLFLGAKK